MADEILVNYKVNVDGFKASLKSVQEDLKTTEKSGTVAADKTTKSFEKTVEKTKSLKAQLRELKAQLANATDPKDVERLAKAAGQLADKIEDASDAAKVFASGSKFEQIGSAFGSVVSKIGKLDFGDALAQSKLLLATTKSLTFKESLAGIKDLGGTLINVGKSLLLNPLFLLASAIPLLISNWDKLTAAFSASSAVVKKLSKETEELHKQSSLLQASIENEIKVLEAQGASEERLLKTREKLREEKIKDAKASLVLSLAKINEIKQNDSLYESYLRAAIGVSKFFGDNAIAAINQKLLDKEKKERIGELEKDAIEQAKLVAQLNTDSVVDEIKTNKKIQEEAERLAKVLRDLRVDNVASDYERRKQQIINSFADEAKNYKGHNAILIELEKKKNKELNDLAAEREAKNKKILEDAQKDYSKIFADGVKDIEAQDVEFNKGLSERLKNQLEEERKLEEGKRKLKQDAQTFAISLLNNAFQLQQYYFEQQIQDTKDASNAAVSSLDNELATKQISQEVYNQRKKEIDNKAAEDEAKLRRRAYEAQKQAAYIQTIISTAQGVANALTVTPAQLVPAYIAIALATGAAQAALISSQPTPKFEDGGRVGGRRHSQGGTLIEAEKDEYIINRGDAIKHYSLLEAINDGKADKFIHQKYIAPILKEQQKKFKEAQNNSFADNIVSSMLLNSGAFKDGNLLESLKRSRQSDRENAIFIVKELTKGSKNSRNW